MALSIPQPLHDPISETVCSTETADRVAHQLRAGAPPHICNFNRDGRHNWLSRLSIGYSHLPRGTTRHDQLGAMPVAPVLPSAESQAQMRPRTLVRAPSTKRRGTLRGASCTLLATFHREELAERGESPWHPMTGSASMNLTTMTVWSMCWTRSSIPKASQIVSGANSPLRPKGFLSNTAMSTRTIAAPSTTSMPRWAGGTGQIASGCTSLTRPFGLTNHGRTLNALTSAPRIITSATSC